MKYRRLGASDLDVSVISLGSWLNFGVGPEKERSIACVNAAFDHGINFFDTANNYGHGAAETALGEALAGRKRDTYVLATKVWAPMSETDFGLSRAQIEKQLDASLVRLRVDFVDLYQCHRYDPDTPLDETMEALTRAVRAGKARWLGFSEWPPQRVAEAFALPQVERFVSSQPQYSILFRRPEAVLIPYCRDHGVSQIVWSPLAQGVLSGKYAAGAKAPEESRARGSQVMREMISAWMRPEVIAAVEKMRPLARAAGCSMAQFALAWVLREPNVASAIVGASRPEQLAENAGAAELRVDPGLFAEASLIAADVPPFRP